MSKILSIGEHQVLLDEKDFDSLMSLDRPSFWVIKGQRCKTHYACVGYYVKGRRIKKLIHRFIIRPGYKRTVDHINRNGLDNRRQNLREVSQSFNNMNTGMHCHNTSGVKGVNFHTHTGKWRAFIQKNGKQIHLGVFPSKDLAVRARRKAEEKYFGAN